MSGPPVAAEPATQQRCTHCGKHKDLACFVGLREQPTVQCDACRAGQQKRDGKRAGTEARKRTAESKAHHQRQDVKEHKTAYRQAHSDTNYIYSRRH